MYCEHCGNQLGNDALFCSGCGQQVKPRVRPLPPPLPPQPVRSVDSGRKGTTMGSLVAIVGGLFLFFVVFIGIIAAIAIPNLLNAIQRANQKRTMAEMRAIGSAIEAYNDDYNALPAVDSIDKLEGILYPKYVRQFRTTDAWHNEFRYICEDPTQEWRRYFLISAGKDGVWDHDDPHLYTSTPIRSFNNDLVYSGGKFIRYPELPSHYR